jgi:hypothetical protein
MITRSKRNLLISYILDNNYYGVDIILKTLKKKKKKKNFLI